MVLLATVALALSACAKEKPPLIADESAQRESVMPWNQQENWENKGQFGDMEERMGGGSRGR